MHPAPIDASQFRAEVVQILSQTANDCVKELGYYPGLVEQFNQTLQDNSFLRQENETLRQRNEILRQENETLRQRNGILRQENEALRTELAQSTQQKSAQRRSLQIKNSKLYEDNCHLQQLTNTYRHEFRYLRALILEKGNPALKDMYHQRALTVAQLAAVQNNSVKTQTQIEQSQVPISHSGHRASDSAVYPQLQAHNGQPVLRQTQSQPPLQQAPYPRLANPLSVVTQESEVHVTPRTVQQNTPITPIPNQQRFITPPSRASTSSPHRSVSQMQAVAPQPIQYIRREPTEPSPQPAPQSPQVQLPPTPASTVSSLTFDEPAKTPLQARAVHNTISEAAVSLKRPSEMSTDTVADEPLKKPKLDHPVLLEAITPTTQSPDCMNELDMDVVDYLFDDNGEESKVCVLCLLRHQNNKAPPPQPFIDAPFVVLLQHLESVHPDAFLETRDQIKAKNS